MAQALSGAKQARCLSKTVNIIGFPINSGQPKKGTELGPDTIRASGLKDKILRKGLSIHDSGDLELELSSMNHSTTSQAKNAAHVSASCQLLSQTVAKSVCQFDKTVILGGDHSLGLGSIHGHAMAGLSAGGIAVLWIDAHAGELFSFPSNKKCQADELIPSPRVDINTESTSRSGNMHGMPVSFILKGLQTLHSFQWMSPVIHASNFAFIGLRDVENVEQDLIKQVSPEITVFTSAEVRKEGAGSVLMKALERINPNNDLPIHVSFDIDVIDPKIARSTGTAVPNGLVPDDAYIFGEIVSKTGRLRVMDMVEVNPLIGTEREAKITAFVASEIISSFLQLPAAQ